MGLLLWNIFYDGILDQKMPAGVTTVAFADDLAILATAKTDEKLINATNVSIEIVEQWMGENKLTLCAENIEALRMVGRERQADILFKIGN